MKESLNSPEIHPDLSFRCEECWELPAPCDYIPLGPAAREAWRRYLGW